ncbi:MAG: O-antigen ligase family protein [Hyphomonadaceae bacterium]|nr:O-antigen ligase family protein [Hyphomonadaceae bacterium]
MSSDAQSDALRARAFAPVFAGLMVLWPLMAILGAQGYAPLLTLVGLFSLVWLRWPARPPLVALLAIALVAWVSASTAWSPAAEGGLVSGSLLEGTFSIEVSAFRLVGTALMAILALSAALQISDGQTIWAGRVLIAVFALHLLLTLTMPMISGPLLALAYDDPFEAKTAGLQNMLRAINACALILPILTTLMWTFGRLGQATAIIVTLASAAIMALLGSAAGLLSVLLAPLTIGLVALLPRIGFRLLFAGMSLVILAAPALGLLAGLAERFGIVAPASFQARLWAWQRVTENLAEQPIHGHGIEAASTWRETYADHPDWLAEMVTRGEAEYAWSNYPVIPTHPHNMGLQIWAETGLIGALLAAATLLAIGWTLPQARTLSPQLRFAIAGLAGASVSLFSFSYSVWNEAFWASIVLAVIALIIIAKGRPA